MTEMTDGEATESVHRALAVPSRRRLMSLLREADGLLAMDELTAATGLSAATVRHHLAALAEAGLVRAERSAGTGRGRPKLLYAAVPAVPGGGDEDRAYRDLAGALVDALAADAPSARDAGRTWGGRLARAAPPAPAGRRVDAPAPRLGFDPETVPAPAGTDRILLHGCPYRELARKTPEVVCALHQGLLDGLLEGDGTRAELHPFLAPDLCRADLVAR
ncbi:metalloregulator ArsR/SmtB family transcription factor [Streptomyces sp. N35]|uniref:helix-turn-helix transcriptional regulator n=1 Tax=Streptomyces sp. N35 TaxID=2795730 RepID=UPI0018F73AD5|nr:ArsR family transcriptional regulator [Streptomyces sp. N35]